jgi:hypothetical protein
MLIKFNPDNNQKGGALTASERTEYMEYCRLLTSDEPDLNYSVITDRIVAFIIKETRQKCNDLELTPEQKRNALNELDIIFQNMDITDSNFIGRVNIISFQCIILFTKYSLINIDPSKQRWKFTNVFSGGRSEYEDYKIYENIFTTYDAVKDLILNSSKWNVLYFKYRPYARYGEVAVPYHAGPKIEDELIFLINIVDYLSLDEIIISAFNNIIYMGMTSKITYADGAFLTPFEFLGHDLAHGLRNYSYCVGRHSVNYKKLLQFYIYCKSALNREDFYCIKFMIFMLFHETTCGSLDITSTINVEEMIHFLLTFNFGNLDYGERRFLNLNDLGLAFPRLYRPDESKSYDENLNKINEYLFIAVSTYKREIDNWIKYANVNPGANPFNPFFKRTNSRFNANPTANPFNPTYIPPVSRKLKTRKNHKSRRTRKA